MKNTLLTELTVDEQYHLKGGFTNISKPDASEGWFRNDNCPNTDAIFNGNCGCYNCNPDTKNSEKKAS